MGKTLTDSYVHAHYISTQAVYHRPLDLKQSVYEVDMKIGSYEFYDFMVKIADDIFYRYGFSTLVFLPKEQHDQYNWVGNENVYFTTDGAIVNRKGTIPISEYLDGMPEFHFIVASSFDDVPDHRIDEKTFLVILKPQNEA